MEEEIKKNIEKIKIRHQKIWQAYKTSDKTKFADYWRIMDKLSDKYFKMKSICSR